MHRQSHLFITSASLIHTIHFKMNHLLAEWQTFQSTNIVLFLFIAFFFCHLNLFLFDNSNQIRHNWIFCHTINRSIDRSIARNVNAMRWTFLICRMKFFSVNWQHVKKSHQPYRYHWLLSTSDWYKVSLIYWTSVYYTFNSKRSSKKQTFYCEN